LFLFLKIKEKNGIMNGNVNELRNISESPRKSSLFFLTVNKKSLQNKYLGITLCGDKV